MSPTDQRVADDTAEFRISTGDDLSEVKSRMRAMEQQHVEIQKAVAESAQAIAANTALTMNNTDQISNVSASLKELFESLSGVIKISTQLEGTLELGGKLGGFAKWVVVMATFGAIIWAVVKYAIFEAAKK